MTIRNICTSLAVIAFVGSGFVTTGCSKDNKNEAKIEKSKLADMKAQYVAAKKAEADFKAKLKDLTPREEKVAAFEAQEQKLKLAQDEQKQNLANLTAEVEKLTVARNEAQVQLDSKKGDLAAANARIELANKQEIELKALSDKLAARGVELDKMQAGLNEVKAYYEVFFKDTGRNAEMTHILNSDGIFNLQISVTGNANTPVLREVRKILSSTNLNPNYVSSLSPTDAQIAGQAAALQNMGNQGLAPSTAGAATQRVQLAQGNQNLNQIVRDRFLISAKGSSVGATIAAAEAYLKSIGEDKNLLIIPHKIEQVVVAYTVDIQMKELDRATNTVRTFNVSPIVLREQTVNANVGTIDLSKLADADLSSACSGDVVACVQGLKSKGLLDKVIDTKKVKFSLEGGSGQETDIISYFSDLKTNFLSTREFLAKLTNVSGFQANSEILEKKVEQSAFTRGNGRTGMISRITLGMRVLAPITKFKGYTSTFAVLDTEDFKHLTNGKSTLVGLGASAAATYGPDITKSDEATGTVWASSLRFSDMVVSKQDLLVLALPKKDEPQPVQPVAQPDRGEFLNSYRGVEAPAIPAQSELGKTLAAYIDKLLRLNDVLK